MPTSNDKHYTDRDILPSELTPQERRLTGSTEVYQHDFYTPSVLVAERNSFYELAEKRSNVGFLDISPLMCGLLGNGHEKYVIDLAPLDPDSLETQYDPSIWKVKRKNGTDEERTLLDRDTTIRVYTLLAQMPEYSLHHREGKWKWESEAVSVEGNTQPLEGYTPHSYRK